ncbi:hypothetical protein ACGFMK_40850 [Amycolatopsis sp. NPDC049252]|uniref:hypothetical protein n=1 Tax=Amycolatopsis sp. NPDC049252 TaxID=3363933 RepID=UPI00371C169A
MTGPRELPGADPFALNREQRRQAARVVASTAHDADDCGFLLDVLGLAAADGLTTADTPPVHTPKLLGRRRNTAQPRRR